MAPGPPSIAAGDGRSSCPGHPGAASRVQTGSWTLSCPQSETPVDASGACSIQGIAQTTGTFPPLVHYRRSCSCISPDIRRSGGPGAIGTMCPGRRFPLPPREGGEWHGASITVSCGASPLDSARTSRTNAGQGLVGRLTTRPRPEDSGHYGPFDEVLSCRTRLRDRTSSLPG